MILVFFWVLYGFFGQYIICGDQKYHIPSAMASKGISMTWTWGSVSTSDHLKLRHIHGYTQKLTKKLSQCSVVIDGDRW